MKLKTNTGISLTKPEPITPENIKDKIKKGYDSIYRFGFNKNMNLYLNEVKKYL